MKAASGPMPKIGRASDRADCWLGGLGLGIAGGVAVLLLSVYLFISWGCRPLWPQLPQLLTSAVWQPLGHPAQTGLLTMVVSTLWCATGALLIAAPLGVAGAVFLAEFAPYWLAGLIRSVLQLLTGIPSVVYGFLGAVVLVKYFEGAFLLSSGESLFCGSLILSVMILPYIVSGVYVALRQVPAEYRESALALGVSKPYLCIAVLLPLVRASIAASVSVAYGRAAGETMAVLMVAGNTLDLPGSWLAKGEPLSALIALELGSAEVGSLQHQGLFAAGLTLLSLVTLINLVAQLWLRRYRREVSNL